MTNLEEVSVFERELNFDTARYAAARSWAKFQKVSIKEKAEIEVLRTLVVQIIETEALAVTVQLDGQTLRDGFGRLQLALYMLIREKLRNIEAFRIAHKKDERLGREFRSRKLFR